MLAHLILLEQKSEGEMHTQRTRNDWRHERCTFVCWRPLHSGDAYPDDTEVANQRTKEGIIVRNVSAWWTCVSG